VERHEGKVFGGLGVLGVPVEVQGCVRSGPDAGDRVGEDGLASEVPGPGGGLVEACDGGGELPLGTGEEDL
jgi:hypothetical protein